ncbi:uracil-DNA glycosylase [bacterium]|nr:uracil-DNA glycosylase [bacterium]
MNEIAEIVKEIKNLLEFQAVLGAKNYPKELLTLMPRGKRPLAEQAAERADCRLCGLHESRNKVVFGAGDPNANLLIVGEAPGAEEDRMGIPFIGRAGGLLTKILASINFTRDEVYIANVLKCRPPGNRDPQPAEVEACEPFLKEQIETIQPKLICALGAHAARTLLKLGSSTSIGSLRGALHNYHGVPLIATYHPAYLLRSPGKKRDTWEDVQFLRREYDRIMSGDAK